MDTMKIRTSTSNFLKEHFICSVYSLTYFLQWLWTHHIPLWVILCYFCNMFLHLIARRVLFIKFIVPTIQSHYVVPHTDRCCHKLWQLLGVLIHIQSVFVVKNHKQKKRGLITLLHKVEAGNSNEKPQYIFIFTRLLPRASIISIYK